MTVPPSLIWPGSISPRNPSEVIIHLGQVITSLLLLEYVTDQGGVETLYMYSATLEAWANFVSRDEIALNLLFNVHFNYSFYPSFYSLELF